MFTRFHRSFEPTFHPERLGEPAKLKKPSLIFCCSVSDLFADWTKPEWRDAIISTIEKYPQHTFQLLTKQPQNIKKFRKPENVWMGVTVNYQSECWKIKELLKNSNAAVNFVSFEPLLEQIITDLKGIDWVIIGKLTGSRRVKLQKEWVQSLISQANRLGIPVFVKNNILWENKRQEFPHSYACIEQ